MTSRARTITIGSLAALAAAAAFAASAGRTATAAQVGGPLPVQVVNPPESPALVSGSVVANRPGTAFQYEAAGDFGSATEALLTLGEPTGAFVVENVSVQAVIDSGTPVDAYVRIVNAPAYGGTTFKRWLVLQIQPSDYGLTWVTANEEIALYALPGARIELVVRRHPPLFAPPPNFHVDGGVSGRQQLQ